MIFETSYKINGLTFSGERIEAISWNEAEYRAKLLGLDVVGVLIAEIPTDDSYNPIWDKMIDYDTIKNN